MSTQIAHETQILSAIRDIYLSRLLTGVAISLAVYDWILVFAQEVETIYQSARWTMPKTLYVYIRAITPMGILLCTFQLSDIRSPLSDRFCTIWAFVQTFGMLTSIAAANALLALRLVALYRRNRCMVWFIYGFFVLSYGATVALVIVSMITYHDALFYSPVFRVCVTKESSPTFPPVFYAPAAFELFIFALTAYRAVQDAKIITGPGSAPFLIVLYRDGAIAFFLMVGMRVWNIWIVGFLFTIAFAGKPDCDRQYLTQPLSSFNLGTQMMWAVSTVMTTRVYINLVQLAKRPHLSTMDTRMPVSAGIRMNVHTLSDGPTDERKPRKHDALISMNSFDDRMDQTRA